MSAAPDTDRHIARAALLVSLAGAWLNLLLTTRWSSIAGSVNGPKRPYFVAALIAATVLALTFRGDTTRRRVMPAFVCAGGVVFLLVTFLCWFPPHTWMQVPFLDDWPPRYQSTVEGVRLLKQGALSGWRWTFLGGYPIVTDVTQDLTAWAALPILLLGGALGFHATHLVLFIAIPLLVWWDLTLDREMDRDMPLLAAGIAALFAANYSYFLIRSSDTNSLAGVVSSVATLVAAHAARAGRRGSSVAFVAALTLANYSHRGFFVYTLCFLALDAALARDWRSAARALVATIAALVAGLPVTWDLWRYPAYFIANNVELTPAPFDFVEFLRKVYYNTELLVRPGRWFNDFTGLTNVFLAVIAYTAWQARGRVRFHAAATLAIVGMLRLIYSSVGYVFLRPIHLLPVFIAPVLAWFLLRHTGRLLAWALVAVLALYIQVWFGPVPHLRRVDDFDPVLIAHLRELPGEVVLIENAFHRDVGVSETSASVPTPFSAHFEAMLPDATGKRYYAGMWDCWQWTPYRDQLFASGTFRGRALADVPVTHLTAELRRWGIRHLVVWSDVAKRYLRDRPVFIARWRTERWQDFEFPMGDTRAVVTVGATATLTHITPLGAIVQLRGVREGDPVIVRTNYHPAWTARDEGREIAVRPVDAQLAFDAPRDGDYDVELVYPARRWLLPIAFASLLAGAWVIGRLHPVVDTLPPPPYRA